MGIRSSTVHKVSLSDVGLIVGARRRSAWVLSFVISGGVSVAVVDGEMGLGFGAMSWATSV
jgi:hypothetical protein